MLTQEETAQFTRLNYLAFSFAREEAQKNNVNIPVWLCSSDEARQEMVAKTVKVLNKTLDPFISYDINFFERIENDLGRVITEQHLQSWINSEMEFKKLREEGNPRAFFVS